VCRKYGYVRVSSKDQNEGRQVEKMLQLGIDEQFIFIDKASGKDFDRPQYQHLRKCIQEGNLIYIDALDRLGRNYDEIIKEWKYITRELNADIVILENETLFDSRKFKAMDTVDVDGKRIGMGKLMEDQFLSLLSYVAEQERLKIRKRQREGIDLARKEGRAYGRPKTVKIDDKFIQVYKRWKNKEITATRATEELELAARAMFYRLVNEYKAQENS
jgi:DNA invertase Pin-like site-specific DNA recombinase